MTSDQTVPDENNLWSDHPRPKYPLIRLKCARNTVCARSALETVSDQTLPDGSDLWWDRNHTINKTIVLPWPRPNPDHRSDDCALKITSDQTFVPWKVTPDKLLCGRDHLWSDSIALKIVWLGIEFTLNEFLYFYCNIFISQNLMFALLNSSKEKTIRKALLEKRKKRNRWEKIYFVCQ